MRAGSKPPGFARTATLAAVLLAGSLAGCLRPEAGQVEPPLRPDSRAAAPGASEAEDGAAEAEPVRLRNLAPRPEPGFKGRPGVPADAYRVILAMTLRLKGFGGAEIAHTTSVLGAGRLAPPPGLDLSAFGSRRFRFSRYEPLPGTPEGRSIAGLVDMEDGAGRRLTAEFEAEYRLQDGKLVLERTYWAFAPTQSPQLDLFVVPAQALKRGLGKDRDSYRELRQVLTEAAIDLQDPRSWPEGKRDYAIVVMVRDRVAPEARLLMGVSRAREGSLESGDKVRRYRYNGWPVAILPGAFDLRGQRFWVRVKLAEGTSLAADPAREDRLIGLFALAPR